MTEPQLTRDDVRGMPTSEVARAKRAGVPIGAVRLEAV